jgi:flagellin FlaB
MEKWIRTLRRFAHNKKAISGLETAIVLIAFVIVASAFAYAVLNMGFLATQKSQEVAMGGLQAASSAVVVDGPVYGYTTDNPVTSESKLTTIIFWLKTASGAESVDLNPGKTTIAFQNARGIWPNVWNVTSTDMTFTPPGAGAIGYTTVYSDKTACLLTWEVGTGYLLDRGEKVRVTIDLTALQTTGTTPDGTAGIDAGKVAKNEQLKVIVKPPQGSVLDIVRYAPPEVKTVNDLG